MTEYNANCVGKFASSKYIQSKNHYESITLQKEKEIICNAVILLYV